jgi:colanic acid biosynthesis glycosyl transferase WcaI
LTLEDKTVVFIGLNFYPEDTAIGLYSTQMVDALLDAGAIVKVITAVPYYPQWRIQPPYDANPSFSIDQYKTATVYRYRFYVPARPKFKSRVQHILSFTYGAWKNLRRINHCDLVISIIPFTASAWLGNKLSNRNKCPHWIHIQDFEFDAAIQSGLAGGSTIFKQLFRLESSVLDKASMVSTISHQMLDKLMQKTDSKTYYLPNWIGFRNSENGTEPKHPYFDSSKFHLLYSGNVGEKQDWDFFIAFAKALPAKHYHITIVGAGAKYDQLKEIADLECVSFYPPVPLNQLDRLLRSADAHFLFQKLDVLDTVMPSKLLGMMASGVPSMVVGNPNSEISTVLQNARAGVYLSVTKPNEVIETLEKWRNDPVLASKIGESAVKFVHQNYSKEEILGSWVKELENLIV